MTFKDEGQALRLTVEVTREMGEFVMDRRSESLDVLSREAVVFLETISTLRGLKEVAWPHVSSLDGNPALTSAIEDHYKSIEEEKREVFYATMLEALPIITIVLGGAARPYTDLERSGERDGPTWEERDVKSLLPADYEKEIDPTLADLRSRRKAEPDLVMHVHEDGRVKFSIADPVVKWHFWATLRDIQRSVASPSHSALLMRSTLMMAVSAFEVLISNIHRSCLLNAPRSASEADVKAFSLSDLIEFGSIEDAIDESLRRRSDAFSRGGVRSWRDWFNGRTMSVDMAKLALDWARTQEVFERRNVVTHNGSRASRQYLQNVDANLHGGLVEGSPVDVTPEYVDEALSRLSTLAVLLVVNVRVKLFGKDNIDETSTWIISEQFKLLNEGRFEEVAWMAERLEELDLRTSSALAIKVNGWIAKKRISGFGTCEREIRAWDTSALSSNYKAAQSVLLGNCERALELIQSCLHENLLNVNDLREWPLFHWMRKSGDLDALMMSEDPALEDVRNRDDG